jgi:hypothetical protein
MWATRPLSSAFDLKHSEPKRLALSRGIPGLKRETWGTLREFQSVFEPRLGEFRLVFQFQGFLLGQLD